jgi:hypothetical protein
MQKLHTNEGADMTEHDEDRVLTKFDLQDELLQQQFEADPASFVRAESGIADVGLVANYLIRQALEDADEGDYDLGPLALVAERLGLQAGVLRIVATMSDEELDNLDQLDPELGPAYREAVRRLRVIIETELESSRRIIDGPAGTRLVGAGIDPQVTDGYRQWLTHIESALCRVPRYIEDPDERQPDADLIPDGVESDMFTYDGTDGGNTTFDDVFDDPHNMPRDYFWFRPADICRHTGETVTTLQTVRDVLKAMEIRAPLRNLWKEIACLLRTGEVANWKIITRRGDNQQKRAQQLISQVWKRWAEAQQGNTKSWDWLCKQLDKYVSCKWSHVPWTATVKRRIGDDGRSIPLEPQDLKAPLDHSTLRWQSDLCFVTFTKWDAQGERRTIKKFMPRFSRYHGAPEIVQMTEAMGLPRMHPLVRLIDGIKREANRKTRLKTGLIWISKDTLPDHLQEQIQMALQPGVLNWTISVWFDPYDSGYIDDEANLAHLLRQDGRSDMDGITNALAQQRALRDSEWYHHAVERGLHGRDLMRALFGAQKTEA